MKGDSATLTALAAAAVRAIESYRPQKDRLFEDRLARGFLKNPLWAAIVQLLRLPGIGTAFLALRDWQFPGVIGGLLCRTRFIDDALRQAAAKGLDQVLILGAGCDTRPYRIQGIDQARVFEVDHPATQALKRQRLTRMLGTLPSHVTFVPIDFDQQDLGAAMAAAAFRTGIRTFFIWEGVTQYITAGSVDATFRYVSRAASPGSRIVFTYIHRGVTDGSVPFPGADKLTSAARGLGAPWITGFHPDELPGYLATCDLKIVEHVGASDYQARYLNPLGRRLNIFEIERVVLAEVTSAAY